MITIQNKQGIRKNVETWFYDTYILAHQLGNELLSQKEQNIITLAHFTRAAKKLQSANWSCEDMADTWKIIG